MNANPVLRAQFRSMAYSIAYVAPKSCSAALSALARWKTRHVHRTSESVPILVYQMGKVGSETVFYSIKRATKSKTVFHVHYLSEDLETRKDHNIKAGRVVPPYHFFISEALRNILLARAELPCKIITLVRDPIAVVISGLFQNSCFADEPLGKEERTWDAEKVCVYLERKLRDPRTFDYFNSWFDRELKRVFRLNIFETPFPKQQGFATYRKHGVEALLIRLEDLPSVGPRALSDFLQTREPVHLEMRNSRSQQQIGSLYHEVLQRIKLTPAECREIYSSPLVRHLYSELLIEEFTARWTRRN